MKKIHFTILIVLVIVSKLFAQTIPFNKFEESKIDVGTLYVYDFSKNQENFVLSSKKYYYIKTLDSIESLTIHLKDSLEIADLFRYKFNWDYMMLEKIRYVSGKDKSDIRIGNAYSIEEDIDFRKKLFKRNNYGREKNGFRYFTAKRKFESIPTYFYNRTNLMPLWFALRFYPMEMKKITVNSLSGTHNNEFDIIYKTEEETEVPYGVVKCHKFEIEAKMNFFLKLFVNPKKAFIWLAKEDNRKFMVKYINYNAPSVEYHLVEIKKITIEEWENFVSISQKRLSILKGQ